MERKLISEADSRPLVVLDPRAPGVARRTSTPPCAPPRSLCVHLAARGGCALLLPGDRRATVIEPTCSAWPHAHVRLALRRRPHRARRWRRPGRAPRARVLSSPPASRRAPRAALGHAAGGGRCLIVPGGDGLPDRAPRRAAHERRPAAGARLHRRGLHRLRAAAAAAARRRSPDGRRRAARAPRWPRPQPARAAPERVARWAPSLALAALRRPALGARWSSPRQARRHGLSRSSPLGGGRALLIARPAAAPRARGAPRPASWPSCCSCSRCWPRGVADEHAAAGAAGTSCASGIVAGIGAHCRRIRCPTAASTSGCASRSCSAARRCWRSPRCSPSGRGAARRRAARSPRRRARRRSTRSRSSSTDPTRRSSRRDVLRSCSPASCGSSALRADRRRRPPRCLRGGHRVVGRDRSRRALDSDAAVVRLRGLRREARARRRPTAFSWDHGYGPLDWPRDGRELLRVKAKSPAYWKATNLDAFDGVRWRDGPHVARRDSASRASNPQVAADDQGRRPRPALDRSSSAPASCEDILPGRLAPGAAPERRHLRDLEQAAAPRRQLPGARLRPAPERAPARALRAPTTPATRRTSSSCRCPLPRARRRPRGPGDRASRLGHNVPLRFAAYGTDGGAARRVAQRLRRSEQRRRPGHGRLAATPALRAGPAAQARRPTPVRLRAGRPATASRRGRTYDETPPQRRLPLAAFLFDTDRLLPAVLRRDGAAAAHGRRARARGVGLQPGLLRQRAQGLRRARPRRPLVGRGLLPAPTAGSRSTRRPPRRRPRSQLDDTARAPTAARRCRPTSAAPGPVGRPPVRARRPGRRRRAHRRGRRLEARPSAPPLRRPRWRCSSGVAAAGAGARRS